MTGEKLGCGACICAFSMFSLQATIAGRSGQPSVNPHEKADMSMRIAGSGICRLEAGARPMSQDIKY